MSFSVVIPCPRGHSHPTRTLESLLTQESGEQLLQEIVLVTAGEPSPELTGSLDDLRARFDGRLRAVAASPDANAVALWNAGVAATSSRWVSVLTSRVTVRPHFVRALAECAERSANASVLRGGWTRARASGAPEQHTLLSVRTVTHAAESLYEQRFGPKASTASAAICRRTWDEMGGLPPEISLLGDWIGDWALWLTAGALGDTVRSPSVLADIYAAPAPTPKSEEVRQIYDIYRDILPRTTAAAHLDKCEWIEAASRKRFRDVTIAASNDLHPRQEAERQEIAAALLPWAEAVDQLPLLTRFRAGERIRSFALGQKLKPALRRVVAAVR